MVSQMDQLERNYLQDLHKQPEPKPSFIFGEEVFFTEGRFSFQPIHGFKLELDGSVYMHSADGNLEIILIGGMLEQGASIVDYNRNLASEFMADFDEFSLIDFGNDLIQGVTARLNKIQFHNAGEEGSGLSLICSPERNQFFFLLVIASKDRWEHTGSTIFEELKKHIYFNQRITSITSEDSLDQYSDLTNEVIGSVAPGEEIELIIKKDDLSFLLGARAIQPDDRVWVTRIIGPAGEPLYHFDISTGKLQSSIFDRPLSGSNGEVCIFLPGTNSHPLNPGEYRFILTTSSGTPLKEVQAIIRQGKLKEPQAFDINLWIAIEDEQFNNETYLRQFEVEILTALKEELKTYNLIPGKIKSYYSAPDELGLFSYICINQDLTDCSYIIAGSVENQRALNIGLVDQFAEEINHIGPSTIAASAGSPGMILSPVSPHACILVNYSAIKGDFSLLAKEIITQLVIFTGAHPQASLDEGSGLHNLSGEIIQRIKVHPLFYSPT